VKPSFFQLTNRLRSAEEEKGALSFGASVPTKEVAEALEVTEQYLRDFTGKYHFVFDGGDCWNYKDSGLYPDVRWTRRGAIKLWRLLEVAHTDAEVVRLARRMIDEQEAVLAQARAALTGSLPRIRRAGDRKALTPVFQAVDAIDALKKAVPELMAAIAKTKGKE